jgi:heme-degrading monooxygenase HmoA
MEEEVRQAFRSRPRIVDDAPGFQRMEVLRPLDKPAEFWLMTWWSDEASFTDWHRGHDYHDCHGGIPKGLKLLQGSVEIRRLELIAE